MFVTNHVLAGALVGTASGDRPVLAFALGFASHVAMDSMPHWGSACWDPDAGPGARRIRRRSERFLRVARRDGLLGLAVLGACTATGVPPRRAIVAGMLGAAALDADKPCEHFLGVNPFPGWLNRFHGWIQNESPRWLRKEIVWGTGLGVGCTVVLGGRRRLASA